MGISCKSWKPKEKSIMAKLDAAMNKQSKIKKAATGTTESKEKKK